MPSTIGPTSRGTVAAVLPHPRQHRAGRALAHPQRRIPSLGSAQVDAGHPGLRGERHPVGADQLAGVALAQAVPLLGEDDDRAALGRLVGEAGQLGGVGELRLVDAVDRQNSLACRLPRVIVPVLSSSRVLTSPAASTARPDIASTLRCTSRSMPAMPIAESSAPIVVGMRQTSSETSTIR